jgi:hypothetical protein
MVVVLFAAILAAQSKPRRQAGTRETALGRAQSPARSQSLDSAEQEEEPNGKQSAGIKMHGHWTIVVRNPDGSVASRNEFENALTTGAGNGDAGLSQFLARQYAVGTWQVSLGNSNSSQEVCRTSNGTPVICFIVEPTSKTSGTYIFANLGVQLPNTSSSSYSITIAGTATAAAAGAISIVSTGLNACPKSVGPGACMGQAETTTFAMTSHTLATPISIQSGQTISVTVVLSFT